MPKAPKPPKKVRMNKLKKTYRKITGKNPRKPQRRKK